MIGYYAHHVGQGHVHRAAAIAEHLPGPVTILSSLPPPTGWRQDWVQLARDDAAPDPEDPTANGTLHWAPLHDAGLRDRMAAIAAWIRHTEPIVLVSDVSVEVALLARLMGIPVVVIALPGTREDRAHQLGYDIADAILAPWPRLATDICRGLEAHARKVHHVGGFSRFDGTKRPPRADRATGRTVLALRGAGGGDHTAMRPPAVPGWRWISCGPGRWVDDPWPALCAADVVYSSCGLGALSDVAAARRPAVLVPEPRPHDEQCSTAHALARAGLAIVLDHEPSPTEWPRVLDRAAQLDGNRWSIWSSGTAAADAAGVIMSAARAS